MIRFRCPCCGAAFRAPSGAAGRSGMCPKCRKPITIPRVQDQERPDSESPVSRPQTMSIRLIHNVMACGNITAYLDEKQIGLLPRRGAEFTAGVPAGRHVLKVAGPGQTHGECEFVASPQKDRAWEVNYAFPSLRLVPIDPHGSPSSSGPARQILWAVLITVALIVLIAVMAIRISCPMR